MRSKPIKLRKNLEYDTEGCIKLLTAVIVGLPPKEKIEYFYLLETLCNISKKEDGKLYQEFVEKALYLSSSPKSSLKNTTKPTTTRSSTVKRKKKEIKQSRP